MAFEGIGMGQRGQVGASLGAQDSPLWRCQFQVDKRWVADDAEHKAGHFESVTGEGNVLLNGGADIIWERVITRNRTTVASTVASAFSTLAKIGVGNSTATAAASQTALQAATSRWAFSSMAAAYPAHTSGATTGARTVSFRSVFTTAQANFAWQEWGIFNSTAAARRMLNRKQQSLGTKTSAAQWTFTASLTLS